MKTKLFYNAVAFALCAMAVTSCNENIVDEIQNEGLQTLSISVVDEGYKDFSSRAVDDGITTTFENGDQIGVYVVNDGVINQSNIPVTYNGNSWSGNLFYFEGSDYIAYYPYDAELGDLTTMEDLKVALSDKFTTDQSDKTSYRKADYLTAIQQNVTTNNGLIFSMAHNMSLVELNIPICTDLKYDEISDLAVTIGGESYNPYYVGDGMFRCIVPVSESATSVSGTFTDRIVDKPIKFSVNITPSINAYNRLNISYDDMAKLVWQGSFFQGSNVYIEKSEIILPAETVNGVPVAKILNATATVEVTTGSEWLSVSNDDGLIKVTTSVENTTTNKENIGEIKVITDGTEYIMPVRQCMSGYGTILNKKLWTLSAEGTIQTNLTKLFDSKWTSSSGNNLNLELRTKDDSENLILIIDLGESDISYNAVGLMPRLQWTAPAPGKITVSVSNDNKSWDILKNNVDYYKQSELEYEGDFNGGSTNKYNDHYEGIIKWVELGDRNERYIKLIMPYSSSFWWDKFFCFDEMFVTKLSE